MEAEGPSGSPGPRWGQRYQTWAAIMQRVFGLDELASPALQSVPAPHRYDLRPAGRGAARGAYRQTIPPARIARKRLEAQNTNTEAYDKSWAHPPSTRSGSRQTPRLSAMLFGLDERGPRVDH